jgi:hypothetical protein
MSKSTGQIPAAERFALRTVEARIEWWVAAAREAAASAPVRKVAA